ncbi:hypothetical protein PISMIDRAFT_685789 [Pisolithus microcarpus 441]|uniref:Uncharacterized protein n=1 Tax=Pisolithus microcarpus 441 TaxID=765257 RepID=A0A0C9Z3C8_9AGAM|nr:hypothetical protein PISMIDRAFT_685789 [Pisolithus microcarpus 441]
MPTDGMPGPITESVGLASLSFLISPPAGDITKGKNPLGDENGGVRFVRRGDVEA